MYASAFKTKGRGGLGRCEVLLEDIGRPGARHERAPCRRNAPIPAVRADGGQPARVAALQVSVGVGATPGVPEGRTAPWSGAPVGCEVPRGLPGRSLSRQRLRARAASCSKRKLAIPQSGRSVLPVSGFSQYSNSERRDLVRGLAACRGPNKALRTSGAIPTKTRALGCPQRQSQQARLLWPAHPLFQPSCPRGGGGDWGAPCQSERAPRC